MLNHGGNHICVARTLNRPLRIGKPRVVVRWLRGLYLLPARTARTAMVLLRYCSGIAPVLRRCSEQVVPLYDPCTTLVHPLSIPYTCLVHLSGFRPASTLATDNGPKHFLAYLLPAACF